MAKTAYKKKGDVRKSTINFALSPDEKAKVKKMAAAMGISTSSFIRYKLFYENKED